MTPEFSRPVRIDTIGDAPRTIAIEADAAEREALVRRFGLLSLDALSAEAELHRAGDIIHVEGRIRAAVVQACVASAAPVPAKVDDSFKLRFIPEAEPGEEIDLDAEDVDTIDYMGGEIDLGEAVAETLALCLDPFPRAPDADRILKAAGVLSEDEVVTGPFAVLKGLKDQL